MSRFNYVNYGGQSLSKQKSFKSKCEELEDRIQIFIKCPRSKALALTKLEEVYMWIGKGIRNDQLKRNQETESQEERTNS